MINNNLSNLNFENQDSNKINHKDNSFDILYHQGFLEHFEDSEIKLFLKEQSRVSKYIVFDVPISRRNDKIQEFGNERFLSLKQWKKIIKDCNLNIYKITGRRFNNFWKKFVPKIIHDSDFFGKYFGESIIIVCGK
jgi:ubiquinone/menaquinone biosynthesis C-methylase UbiE